MLNPSLKRFHLVPYFFAAVAAACSALLHLTVFQLWHVRAPFLFFLPAVILIALLQGRGPALVVVAAAYINGMFFAGNPAPPVLALLAGRFAPLIFGLVAVSLIVIGSRWRLISLGATETARRLRIVQQHAGVGLFEIDLDTQLVYVSEAMWMLLGREAVSQRRHGQVPLEEWRNFLRIAGMRGADRSLFTHEGVNSYEHECRIHLPDGKARWLLSRVNVERDDEQRPQKLQCASLDITERKRADTALKQTQQDLSQQLSDFRRLHAMSTELLELRDLEPQLNAILEALADFHDAHQGLIWLFDEERGGLVLKAGLGFSEETMRALAFVEPGREACGLACSERKRIIVDDTRTTPCFRDYQHIAEREGFRAVHSTPLISVSGKLMGVVSIHFPQPFIPDEREVVLSDLCARKAAMLIEQSNARRLADEIEQRFRVVVDTAAVGFCLLEPLRGGSGAVTGFSCVYANSTALRLFGRIETDMQKLGWLEAGFVEPCAAAMEQGGSATFESCMPDGKRWLKGIASPIDGNVTVWFRDITVEKAQEVALLDADRRKDEFLATLAHELRNPLAPIRHAAYIVSRPDADESQKQRAAAVMERQVETMARLLEDLLDVARITGGKLELRKERVTALSVIEAAVETARPAIEARRHRFEVDLPDSSLSLHADPLRLSQVLCNLLVNAAKFTGEGGDIRLRAAPEADGILFEVADNGIGFEMQNADGIFELFAQNGQRGGGLGIGLALSKGLVELHGGRIEAVSGGPGKGSRFRLLLPVGGQADVTKKAEDIPVGSPRASRKVLVADDNRDAAEMLADLLKLEGNQVRVSFDREGAMAAFENFRPDITLLDLSIARPDDYLLARRMCAGKAPHARLIAVSGWGQVKDREEAIGAGFDHHLTKPVDPQKLRELLL